MEIINSKIAPSINAEFTLQCTQRNPNKEFSQRVINNFLEIKLLFYLRVFRTKFVLNLIIVEE